MILLVRKNVTVVSTSRVGSSNTKKFLDKTPVPENDKIYNGMACYPCRRTTLGVSDRA